MSTSAEIVRVTPDDRYEGMTLAVAPAEAKKRVAELQAFVSSVMVEGLDFGVIPGTDKPSLLQPGAQKLAEIYGLAHHFEPIDQVKDWERGFFYFEYRCVVTSRRDGRPICEGIGSCNSKESKYAARWVFDREVPAGMNKANLKTKQITSKKNGRTYPMYQVPNEDPFSLVNTIQKMAAKRSYVHAIISATRSAGVFTQDTEDLPAEAFGQPEKERSWEQSADEQAAHPPAPTNAPNPMEALYSKLAAAITLAGDMPTLKKAWNDVSSAAKGTRITLEMRAALADLKDQRKKGIESPRERVEDVLANNPLPESWGGPPEVDAVEETCDTCHAPLGAAPAVQTENADGEVRFRHRNCPPLPLPGEGREDQ